MKKSSNRRLWWGLLTLPLALLMGACESEPRSATDGAANPMGDTIRADAHGHDGVGDLYTCPMHPQIIRDKPGKCPICSMDLVKKPKSSTARASADGPLGNLLRAPDGTVVSALSTVNPSSDAPGLILTLAGRVEYDARRTQVIAARFGGRVEQLLVRFNFQPVTRGQKLMEIYSPQLVTAQEELIFILTHDAENHTLLAGARQKLRLLGLTDSQINQAAATRKPQYQVAIYSPHTGYVVEQPVLPGSTSPPNPTTEAGAAGGGDPMGGGASTMSSASPGAMSSSASVESGLTLTEGAYVTAGQPLFRVVNTDQVWGIFEPQPENLASIRVGQAIRVVAEGDPTRTRTARIDLVEPFFREGASTGAVRVHLSNPGNRLRSGTRLTGSMDVPNAGGLWLPRAAVVDLGDRQIAFVREKGGAFRSVPVQTGLRSADRVQVLRGLTEQDAVATNAQFLVDSEGFVQTPETDYSDE